MRYLSASDSYITGHFGEDSYSECFICSECRKRILDGEQYYDVNGTVYCNECQDAADEHILSLVRDDYIFEL